MARLRQRLPLVQYWEEGEWIPAAESRNDGGLGEGEYNRGSGRGVLDPSRGIGRGGGVLLKKGMEFMN